MSTHTTNFSILIDCGLEYNLTANQKHSAKVLI